MMLKEYLTQTLLSYVNIPLSSWPPSITPYVVILAEFNQPSASVPAQPGEASSICGLRVSGCRLLWEQQNRKVILEVTVPNAQSCTWEMELCRFLGHRAKVWRRRKFWVMLGMSWIIKTETGMSTRRLAGERSGSTEHTTIKRCYRAKHKWGQLRWFSNCFLFMMGGQRSFEVEENIDK